MADSAVITPGADPNALHNNVDAEIALIAEKTAPALDDLVVLESADDSNAKRRAEVGNMPFAPGQNFLDFGEFSFVQRGSSFTSATTPANDDFTVLLDRWLLLSDGNDVVDVSREQTIKPTDSVSSLKLEVETVDLKFGHMQVLEKTDTQLGFDDDIASFSFAARRLGSSLVRIRAAIIVFDQASGLTDPISAWNAQGVNPTLATNWAFANTPAALADLTTDFQTFKIENVTIPSGTESVAVMVWSDETTTTLTDALYLSKMKLERGPVATPYVGVKRFVDDPLSNYYFMRVGKGTTAQAISSTSFRVWGEFAGAGMRAAPTMTMTVTNPSYLQGGSVRTATGSTLSSVATNPRGWTAEIDGFTGLTVGEVAVNNGDIVFTFDAEIV